MKKLILILIAMIALCSFVLADGNISVYSLRVYNDGTSSTTTWDDDTINSNPGVTLQLQIRMQNDWNDTINVQVKGLLSDIGGDLTRTQSKNIDSGGARQTFVLEYYIPSDTQEGSYDLRVTYSYSINGTSFSPQKTFSVNIAKPKIDSNVVLMNLTQALSNTYQDRTSLLSVIDTLSKTITEKTNCQAELQGLKLNSEISDKWEESYNVEKNYSSDINDQLLQCKEEKITLFTKQELDNQVRDARSAQQKDDNNVLLFVVVGGVGFYLWKKKKETVGGGGVGKSLMGKWK